MMPQELKSSILWNAIQGKLTQQVEGESASELLSGICLSPVFGDEVYFEIPSNWCWCKIKDIFELVNGKAFKPTDWGTQGLPIVRIQNLNDANSPYNYYDGEIERKYILYGGELLFSWSGTPGTSFGAFIWNGGKAVLNQHIFIVYPKFEMDYEYARYALNGEIKIFIDKAHGGAGLKHITKKEFENCILPIPPLAEQKRIVAKIEELLPYIDRYEKAWSRLEDFNRHFPADMQKSILQMAIQGKLVEQQPEEGTGEELYRQIQAEKQKLIKEGKIKKEKPLPEIAEDEIPFEIPEGWKWIRLSQLVLVLNGDRGKNYPAKSTLSHNGIPFISALNLDGKSVVDDDNLLRMSEQQYERLRNGKLIKDDIVVCIRGSLGKHGRYPFTQGAIASSLVILRLFLNHQVIAEFLMMYLDTPLFFSEIRKYDNGTAQPNLAAKSLEQFIIPLPPLAEQKRIVAKLEEILPLCEKLK